MSNLNWEPFKPNQHEIEWATMQKEVATQLARVFDIPPSFIGTVDIIVEGSAIVLGEQLLLQERVINER